MKKLTHSLIRSSLLSNFLYQQQSGVGSYIACNPVNRYETSLALQKNEEKDIAQQDIQDIDKVQSLGLNKKLQDTESHKNSLNQASQVKLKKPYEEQVEKIYIKVNQCNTLLELQTLMQTTNVCHLKKTAKNMVFGDGNTKSGIVFIGEIPGRDEDLQGKPFVGSSGQLLDNMLASIKMDRSQCYVMHVFPWRVPGNRAFSEEEKAMCLPFLIRHITLLNPKLIVLLGDVAIEAILQIKKSVLHLRGQLQMLDKKKFNTENDIPTITTLSPETVLKKTIFKKLVWEDFQHIYKKMINLK